MEWKRASTSLCHGKSLLSPKYHTEWDCYAFLQDGHCRIVHKDHLVFEQLIQDKIIGLSWSTSVGTEAYLSLWSSLHITFLKIQKNTLKWKCLDNITFHNENKCIQNVLWHPHKDNMVLVRNQNHVNDKYGEWILLFE